MKKESYGYDVPASSMGNVESNKQKIHSINIEELDYGYILRVGCKSFAFIDKQLMLDYLTKYMDNPQEMENKYYNNELFK